MKKYAANAALGIFAITLTFTILEAVYRVDHFYKVQKILRGRSEKDLLTQRSNDERIYELKPNTAITNQHGFRDLPRKMMPNTGDYRIVVIGDSVSMQPEIPLEKLYFRQLQKLLDKKFPEKNIEILNFGVTGYSVSQELALLRLKALNFQPDAILWQFHDNDSFNPANSNADGEMFQYYYRPYSYLFRFVKKKIAHYQKKYFVNAHSLQGISSEMRDHLFYWKETTKLFDQVALICKERGIDVYMFMYPSWPDDNKWENYPERRFEIHQKLKQRFETLGFETLDLLPLLRDINPKEFRVSENDPWHPNEHGHKWIAEQLANWLENIWMNAKGSPISARVKRFPPIGIL